MTGEARRTLGPKLERIDGLRERAEFRLHLHLQREGVLLRLVELDDETALGGRCARLDIPREHVRALHGGDVALAAHEQHDAVQLALHYLAVEHRDLAHEAWAE